LEDISYLTHPDLCLTVAIQMTCGLPILLTPICIDNKCYTDGGIICNYSLKYCVDSGKKEDEILGLKNKYANDETFIKKDSSILDYMLTFFFKLINNVSQDHIQPIIKNEVNIDMSFLSMEILKNALSNIQVRKDLLKKGEYAAKIFLENIKKEN